MFGYYSNFTLPLCKFISGILKCVEGSFTSETLAYLEQNLKTENGSKFIETIRKLEKTRGIKNKT